MVTIHQYTKAFWTTIFLTSFQEVKNYKHFKVTSAVVVESAAEVGEGVKRLASWNP